MHAPHPFLRIFETYSVLARDLLSAFFCKSGFQFKLIEFAPSCFLPQVCLALDSIAEKDFTSFRLNFPAFRFIVPRFSHRPKL
jgi:hypothetical protein